MKILLLFSILFAFTSMTLPQDVSITGNVYYDNAFRYYNAGDFQKAIYNYTEYLKSYPKNSKAFNERGLCYENLEQYEMAEKDYSAAIFNAPNNWEYYNNRGYAYLRLGKPQQSLSDFSQAIIYSAQKSECYVGRMEAYIAIGNYQLALNDINAAINLDQDNPAHLINRGIVFMYLEDTVQLYKSIDTILKIDPHDYYVRLNFRYKLFVLKKFFNMIEKLSSYIMMYPKDPILYFRRGFNYYFIRKYDLATNDFQTCIKLLPESETTITNFAKRFIENCNKF